MPNSALAVVHKIYMQAMEEQDNPQLVKAILYRISLNSTFEENSSLGAINELKSEIETSAEPVTQILHSILGELYSNYYQWNQYRISGRSALEGNNSENPEEWDAKRILYEIILNYRQSLSNETDLQAVPLERFKPILEHPVLNSGKQDTTPSIHTTLFDFLAYRALEFFTRSSFPVIQSSNTFTLNSEAFFAQSSKFAQYPLKPMGIHARPGDGTFIPPGTDTLSLPWYA
ncbi:MAG: hypothetical protein IH596_13865, partial [Bacteroidales bacterium]|nr:hypothetical protein [Bacteroidales bacterium]